MIGAVVKIPNPNNKNTVSFGDASNAKCLSRLNSILENMTKDSLYLPKDSDFKDYEKEVKLKNLMVQDIKATNYIKAHLNYLKKQSKQGSMHLDEC